MYSMRVLLKIVLDSSINIIFVFDCLDESVKLWSGCDYHFCYKWFSEFQWFSMGIIHPNQLWYESLEISCLLCEFTFSNVVYNVISHSFPYVSGPNLFVGWIYASNSYQTYLLKFLIFSVSFLWFDVSCKSVFDSSLSIFVFDYHVEHVKLRSESGYHFSSIRFSEFKWF